MLTFFAYIIPYQQLASMANPAYTDDGELLDGGFDMSTGGICGYVSLMFFIFHLFLFVFKFGCKSHFLLHSLYSVFRGMLIFKTKNVE